MKAVKAYTKGWQFLFNNWKMCLILYAFNVGFAIVAAFPLNNYLQSTVAHTLSIQESLKGFNYAIISDFLNEYGTGLAVVFNQSLLILLLFLLVSIFLTGGILNVIKYYPARFESGLFWQGCIKYFWRLFRLTFYFLIVQGLVLFIAYKVYTFFSGGINFFELESDKQLIDAFKIVFPFYLFLVMLLFLIQDYIKIHLIHEEKYLLTKPIWKSVVLVFKNFLPFFVLYLFNLITFLLLFGAYWFISELFQTETLGMIILVFAISQVSIIARIGSRLINLSSVGWMYKSVGKNELIA